MFESKHLKAQVAREIFRSISLTAAPTSKTQNVKRSSGLTDLNDRKRLFAEYGAQILKACDDLTYIPLPQLTDFQKTCNCQSTVVMGLQCTD